MSPRVVAKELSYTVQISNWTVYPRIEGAYIVASCVKTKFKHLARWYPATVSAQDGVEVHGGPSQ